MWQDNNWAVYWLYNNAEQLHYCVVWHSFYIFNAAKGATDIEEFWENLSPMSEKP